ncbi:MULTISPECIES: replication-associated recombination protein A [unclassified Gilliamella]|uniref:replication-associated recombination protein A n=1 Tax=unclassified Gilliamella TaxID=2685620 RepID=UPI00226A83A3|nr:MULTISPECIES: replication-associated recombination protein A [unclassified Gilliamella]MCX8601275.1 replication-associated recombination protein A [Gilliamella sp. B3722]MCX8607429.1 replication-associated recombination protein A [Gilliamella sp. B3771]MCX8610382.1 replication-associated recombination protein A [Gilliamella sp. B3891]MCX8612949.1 replication-associated recombination protein A [Gilliamella sp. B3773]MCX8614858.1 replication-associated recombination protein A [Gilliamella sp.
MPSMSFEFTHDEFQPLAARMRPRNLSEYIGQTQLLGKDKPLRQAIEAGHLHSMILWGPPGTGKTTLAEIIAHHANAKVERISAVTSGIKDIREAISRAQINQQAGIRTILFVDEVHRFNKSQQDAFLPYVENGTVTFIGATTENPSFELNSALLSRARVYLLKSLTNEDIEQILQQAMDDPERGYGNRQIVLPQETKQQIAEFVGGDARRALNTLELLVDMSNGQALTTDLLKQVIGERSARFDNQGDRYYDLISAVHKSIRGSSPDAALYWYARIISAGGDPLYVARRLLAIASEDVGNADPRAMQVALAAWDCFTRVGPAEGERAIAQAIVYLACAPKSNAVYLAFKQAMQDAQSKPDYDVPEHLRNAPTKLMKELGYGDQYRYAHDEPNAFAAGENYFPPELADRKYYHPTTRGAEKSYTEKLAWLDAQNQASLNQRYKSSKK